MYLKRRACISIGFFYSSEAEKRSRHRIGSIVGEGVEVLFLLAWLSLYSPLTLRNCAQHVLPSEIMYFHRLCYSSKAVKMFKASKLRPDLDPGSCAAELLAGLAFTSVS